jgi:hypothetical protein
MSTYRVRRRSHYTVIPNAALRDSRLSWKATGLLAVMLSYPDDWEFNQAHLVGLKGDGLTAVRAALRELQIAGFLTRTPRRDSDTGRMTGHDWIVSDTSSNAVEHHDTSSTDMQETRRSVEPMSGNPMVGESHPTKTERSTKTERHEEPPVGEADEAAGKTEEPQREEQPLSQEVVAIWNAGCGKLTQARVLSAAAEKLIRAESKRHGRERFIELFRAGLPSVRSDDYWLGNRAERPRRVAAPYGLINYLRVYADKANEALTGHGPAAAAPTPMPIQLGERWWTHTQGAVMITAINGAALWGTVERKHPQHPEGPEPGVVIKLTRDDLKVMRAGGSVERSPF